MYLLDPQSNSITPIERKSFTSLSFTERYHLQEWIDKTPAILGEELLIIQKEFDGFSDTNERLDLLALDAEGRLVLIENKLDDSGRDVVWQALKYVSYCASLTKSEIRDIYQKYLDRYHKGGSATEKLAEYYGIDYEELAINTDDSDQRIILVAANFRREVTSTVLWLQKHGLDIKCIRITPYQRGEDVLLNAEQVLPPPDVEEYQIKLAQKRTEVTAVQGELQSLQKQRLAFWGEALPVIQQTADLYWNVSPTKDNWVMGASGHKGINYNCVINKTSARAELIICMPELETTRGIYNALLDKREQLEKAFGGPLQFVAPENKRTYKVFVEKEGVGLLTEDSWPQLATFYAEGIRDLQRVLNKPLEEAYKRYVGK